MKISFSTIPGNLTTNIGYGYAGFQMVRALQRLGHQVPFQDSSCRLQIHFSQPEWYEFFDHQYKIGYTPWESSELPCGWVETFNELDELWTTSDTIATWYKEAGVNKDIRVYEHGLDEVWTPSRRRPGHKIKFLHMGEPAQRKGGSMALQAFLDAFGNQDDVQLTIKSNGHHTVRLKDSQGSIVGLPEHYSNVKVLTRSIPLNELVSLFHNHDCLVYPGWGEGFGLIPLQAIGTGMPVICTEAWAPYRKFILPELKLSSTIVDSPWPMVHPGKMFQPDYDQLVSAYKDVYNNYDRLAGRSFRGSFDAHKEYNWDTLTKNAFAHLV